MVLPPRDTNGVSAPTPPVQQQQQSILKDQRTFLKRMPKYFGSFSFIDIRAFKSLSRCVHAFLRPLYETSLNLCLAEIEHL